MKYNNQIFLFVYFLLTTLSSQRKNVQILEKLNKIDKHIDHFNKIPIHNDNLKQNKMNHHTCSTNCLQCKDGLCQKCPRGYYSYTHSCYEDCPLESVADNVDLTCKMKDQNPSYTKAYTFSSCLNSCGNKFKDCR